VVEHDVIFLAPMGANVTSRPWSCRIGR